MRRDHEAPGIGTVAPHEFGAGYDARDSFGALALGHAQPVAPALEGGLGNDAIHQLALLGAVFKDVGDGLTQRGLGEAFRYGVGQGSEGSHSPAEDMWSAHDFSDACSGDHLVSVYPISGIK